MDTLPPLSGSKSWAQAGQPLFKPPASQLGALSPNVEFPNSELLRLLAAAKKQQDSLDQEPQLKGYDFTPYLTSSSIVAKDYDYEGDDDGKEADDVKPSPSVVPKDYDDVGGGGGDVNQDDDEDDAKQGIEDSEDSTENSLGYPSTDPGYDEEDIGESHKILKNQSSLKPPVQKETLIEKVKEGRLKPRMDFESVIPAC